MYSSYEKFLLTGDFNIEERDNPLAVFLYERSARNLVKEPTCYRNLENPSCIDLFTTDSIRSFSRACRISIRWLLQ